MFPSSKLQSTDADKEPLLPTSSQSTQPVSSRNLIPAKKSLASTSSQSAPPAASPHAVPRAKQALVPTAPRSVPPVSALSAISSLQSIDADKEPLLPVSPRSAPPAASPHAVPRAKKALVPTAPRSVPRTSSLSAMPAKKQPATTSAQGKVTGVPESFSRFFSQVLRPLLAQQGWRGNLNNPIELADFYKHYSQFEAYIKIDDEKARVDDAKVQKDYLKFIEIVRIYDFGEALSIQILEEERKILEGFKQIYAVIDRREPVQKVQDFLYETYPKIRDFVSHYYPDCRQNKGQIQKKYSVICQRFKCFQIFTECCSARKQDKESKDASNSDVLQLLTKFGEKAKTAYAKWRAESDTRGGEAFRDFSDFTSAAQKMYPDWVKGINFAELRTVLDTVTAFFGKDASKEHVMQILQHAKYFKKYCAHPNFKLEDFCGKFYLKIYQAITDSPAPPRGEADFERYYSAYRERIFAKSSPTHYTAAERAAKDFDYYPELDQENASYDRQWYASLHAAINAQHAQVIAAQREAGSADSKALLVAAQQPNPRRGASSSQSQNLGTMIAGLVSEVKAVASKALATPPASLSSPANAQIAKAQYTVLPTSEGVAGIDLQSPSFSKALNIIEPVTATSPGNSEVATPPMPQFMDAREISAPSAASSMAQTLRQEAKKVKEKLIPVPIPQFLKELKLPAVPEKARLQNYTAFVAFLRINENPEARGESKEGAQNSGKDESAYRMFTEVVSSFEKPDAKPVSALELHKEVESLYPLKAAYETIYKITPPIDTIWFIQAIYPNLRSFVEYAAKEEDSKDFQKICKRFKYFEMLKQPSVAWPETAELLAAVKNFEAFCVKMSSEWPGGVDFAELEYVMDAAKSLVAPKQVKEEDILKLLTHAKHFKEFCCKSDLQLIDFCRWYPEKIYPAFQSWMKSAESPKDFGTFCLTYSKWILRESTPKEEPHTEVNTRLYYAELDPSFNNYDKAWRTALEAAIEARVKVRAEKARKAREEKAAALKAAQDAAARASRPLLDRLLRKIYEDLKKEWAHYPVTTVLLMLGMCAANVSLFFLLAPVLGNLLGLGLGYALTSFITLMSVAINIAVNTKLREALEDVLLKITDFLEKPLLSSVLSVILLASIIGGTYLAMYIAPVMQSGMMALNVGLHIACCGALSALFAASLFAIMVVTTFLLMKQFSQNPSSEYKSVPQEPAYNVHLMSDREYKGERSQSLTVTQAPASTKMDANYQTPSSVAALVIRKDSTDEGSSRSIGEVTQYYQQAQAAASGPIGDVASTEGELQTKTEDVSGADALRHYERVAGVTIKT